jgi:hypothetical protein
MQDKRKDTYMVENFMPCSSPDQLHAMQPTAQPTGCNRLQPEKATAVAGFDRLRLQLQ